MTHEWNPQAQEMIYMLELRDKDGHKIKMDLPSGAEEPVPFEHFNTFEDVVEELRRKHPKDGQLTKVQVNFATGDVAVFKKLSEAEVVTNRGREWSTKRFNLNRPNDMQRAALHAFQ